VLLIALPPGGVEVAVQVATLLGFALEIVGARPIGMVPDITLSVGAVAEDGSTVFDPDFQPSFAMMSMIETAAESARWELVRQAAWLRGDRTIREMEGRTVIVIDDMILSPWLTLAAADLAEHRRARRVIIASPVGATAAVERLLYRKIDVVCPVRIDGPADPAACYGEASPPDLQRAMTSLLRARSR
jgi:predicted phosphoribosyltransferase